MRKSKIEDLCFENIDNKAFLIGKVIGSEGKGIYAGIKQEIILLETQREGNKKNYAYVLLPDCDKTRDMIKYKKNIIVEGKLAVSYNFSANEVKHVFVLPEKVEVISEDYKVQEEKEFYLNYTLCNRIILKGKIFNKPINKKVESKKETLNVFKLIYEDIDGKTKTVNCSMWETVKDFNLEEGKEVRIVGSFLVENNRVRKLLGKESKDMGRNYTYYTILVQKIFDLDNKPQIMAEKIFV